MLDELSLGKERHAFQPDPRDYSFMTEEPDFKIGAHANLVERLLSDITKQPIYLSGGVLDENKAGVLSSTLCKRLSIPARKRALVRLSLFPRYASRPMDKRLALDIAMLLAGNRDVLSLDQVIEDCQPDFPVWVPMTITDVVPNPEKFRVYNVHFFANAGIYVGSTVKKSLSGKFARFLLSQIGMPRRTRSCDLDLMKAQLLVLLGVSEGRLSLSEFSTSKSQESYNKQLFKVRHGDRPCHNDMECECDKCPIGLDICDFALYKKSEKT